MSAQVSAVMACVTHLVAHQQQAQQSGKEVEVPLSAQACPLRGQAQAPHSIQESSIQQAGSIPALEGMLLCGQEQGCFTQQ